MIMDSGLAERIKQVEELMILAREVDSLDRRIEDSEGGGKFLGDFVPANDGSYILEEVNRSLIKDSVGRHVRSLSAHQRGIIERIYFEGVTEQEIAASMNLPALKIRSAHQRALRVLRYAMMQDPKFQGYAMSSV